MAIARLLARPIAILLETSTGAQQNSARTSVPQRAAIPSEMIGLSDIRSEAEVNAADGSRSGKGRFLCGRALRNGWGSCNQHQAQHPQQSSSFREAVVARRSS